MCFQLPLWWVWLTSVDVLNDLPEDRKIKSVLEKNYFPNPVLGALQNDLAFPFLTGRLASADVAKFPNTLTQVHKNFLLLLGEKIGGQEFY